MSSLSGSTRRSLFYHLNNHEHRHGCGEIALRIENQESKYPYYSVCVNYDGTAILRRVTLKSNKDMLHVQDDPITQFNKIVDAIESDAL